jgi:hypothetical protein
MLGWQPLETAAMLGGVGKFIITPNKDFHRECVRACGEHHHRESGECAITCRQSLPLRRYLEALQGCAASASSSTPCRWQ